MVIWDFHSEFLLNRAAPREILQPIHKAAEYTLETHFPEVQEASKLQAGQPQVGLKLLGKCRSIAIDYIIISQKQRIAIIKEFGRQNQNSTFPPPQGVRTIR